jgi:hypothetical protein
VQECFITPKLLVALSGGQEKPCNISYYFAAYAAMDVTDTQAYPCCKILN